MDRENSRWSDFSLKELLVLYVAPHKNKELNHELNSEIDQRFLEHAEKVRAYRTSTGRVLTDADVEALADEAERGYDVGTKAKPAVGQSRLLDALSQVDYSRERAGTENYATRDEVWHLRVAMRSLIAYLQGEGRS